MHDADAIRLLADLAEEHCELDHGPKTDPKNNRATDYLVLPFGYQENAIKEVTVRELVVPVCFECVQALQGDEWTLLYCFECSHSRWVYRKWAKNSYRHHILWLRGCPDCSNKFGGLYFNDIQDMAGHIDFVTNHVEIRAA